MGRQREMRGSRRYVSVVRYEGRGSAPLPGVNASLGARLNMRERAGPSASRGAPAKPGSATPPLGFGERWIPRAHTGRMQMSAGKRIRAVF